MENLFPTNISHFVKFAHVVKLYVAYMRNLHIDKMHSKSAAFAFDSNSSHICQDFITWFKQVKVQLKNLGQINYMSRVARKRFFGVHAPDLPACVHVDTETNTSLLILDRASLEAFQSVQENFNHCSKET